MISRASRLYRTTRRLYEAVQAVLHALGVPALGTPTWAMLLAWVVTGLILLDARPTQTRVARLLPGRCHDALNRLYRLMPLSSRALMGRLIAYAKRLGQDGYLVLDDVIIEKAFAQRLAWAGWTYSLAKKRQGVRATRSRVAVVCRAVAHSGGLPAVAAQA